MNKPIRIFIADDNRLLRESLASMLAEIENINVVGMISKDGLDVTQTLNKDLPEFKVIILGMDDLC